jgi:hypothetical protein
MSSNSKIIISGKVKWQSLKEFFRPTKKKIILALALPYIWILIYFLPVNLIAYALAYKISFPAVDFQISPILIILFDKLVESIFYYPVACALSFLLDSSSRNITFHTLGVFVISILLFNPVTFNVLSFMLTYAYVMTQPLEQCGVYVINVIPKSPAERFGLTSGAIIIRVNNNTVYNVSDFMREIEKIKAGEEIRISYIKNSKEYNTKILVESNLAGNKAFLGINVTNAFVRKNFLEMYCY